MKNLHFISHTHWDREWLRSSDASRIRLVRLFDQLLDILEKDPEYKYFTFDGQTAALEDYLEICPYQEQRVKKLVSEKRLLIGPWYVQPDMIMPSGESLVRNLLIGTNMAQDMGHCMNVGWVPDAFGQIKRTPELFSQFGMDAVFIWRGFDYDMIDDSLFLWQGDGNTKLLAVHMALGYGYYRGLTKESQKDIEIHLKTLNERFKDGEILSMLGSDYVFPSYETSSLLKELSFEDVQILQSNPELYIKAVQETLQNNPRELQVYSGEARSAALGRMHAGITSTRIDIKNQMRYYETFLPKVVEPLGIICKSLGAHYCQDVYNYFWKIIFKNQFHDSMYSSSPETVNQTVENRLLNLRHGLNELVWLSIRHIINHIQTACLKENEDILVLLNTLPYQRQDYAFVSMIVEHQNFVLKDEHDQVIPYILMNEDKEVSAEIEYYNGIHNFHDGGEIIEGSKYRVQLKIAASMIPSMGYKILKVCFDQKNKETIQGDVHIIDDYHVENQYLDMIVNDNGTLTVTNKHTKTTYQHVHTLIESGDDGDEYNYSPPKNDSRLTSLNMKPRIECIESSSIEVVYKITYDFITPARIENHYRIDTEKVTSQIVSYISLKAHQKTIDFHTSILNKGKDHIIKVAFKDVYSSKENLSQDHFGTIVRSNTILKQRGLENGATEEELPIYPMKRFVKLNHNQEAYAIISGGPMEYTIEDDQTLCLTLLRSVGKFGKADLLIRPGRSSGYRLDAPSSQLEKEVTSDYSIYFGDDNVIDDLIKQSEVLTTPIITRYVNKLDKHKDNDLLWDYSMCQVSDGLELIALKQCEKDNGIVYRFNNNTEHDIDEGLLTLHKGSRCYYSNVKEEVLEELEVISNQVKLPKVLAQTFITVIVKESD
ncbi:MAG: glycoside hydrolase family 38 C-terminal domain-containing protein [Coprobacillus sp.]